MEITKRLEFDAGHRVPNHKSKCRNAHGHRYVLETTIAGPILEDRGQSDDGMVVDFGDIKGLIQQVIAEPWDHAFLVFDKDASMITALECLGPGHKTVVLPMVPTAENLVRIAAVNLQAALKSWYGDRLEISRIRLYETPNSWADWEPTLMLAVAEAS